MIVAFQYGGQLPAWGNVVALSELWHIPPWEVTGGDDSAPARFRWAMRTGEFVGVRAKVQKIEHG